MSVLARPIPATPPGEPAIADDLACESSRVAPGGAERLALAAVLLACVAFGLIRQPCNDIGWHLATARAAFATGHWPITNTFSHTHTEYPLDQQYPLFQAALYGVQRWAGWNGLSVLNAAGWLAVLLLFVRWGGSWGKAAWLHLPWMIGLLALQRRMILRPDLVSMLCLAGELLVIDAYLGVRRKRGAFPLPYGRGSVGLVLLPVIHWVWANSHQLFPLSLAVQGLFIGHLLLTRWGRFGVARTERAAPVWPATLALAASVGVSFLTPLGTGIVRVVANTSGSLAHHRGDVQEFAYLWQRPWEMQLALGCGVLGAVGLWRMRRGWRLVDVGLWCGTLVMMLGAVRGLVFFGPVSIALFARSINQSRARKEADIRPSTNQSCASRSRRGDRQEAEIWHVAPDGLAPEGLPTILRWPAWRAVTIAATLVLAGNVVFHRWIRPPLALGGTQPGLGRSLGDWPDGVVAFLRDHPPPGRMLNLPWSLGSPLIWDLPEHPVFVDARLEAYPREFLVECMAAERDDATLAELIANYHPGWIVANHRDADVRARIIHLLAGRQWACVYADTLTLVLVQETPETQAYLEGRRLTPEQFTPGDLLAAPAELQALQMGRFQVLIDESEHRAQAP